MPSCLVIDENNIVLKVAGRVLAGLGVETVGVSTMSEALTLLEQRTDAFDLVLLSATMPDTLVDGPKRRSSFPSSNRIWG